MPLKSLSLHELHRVLKLLDGIYVAHDKHVSFVLNLNVSFSYADALDVIQITLQ